MTIIQPILLLKSVNVNAMSHSNTLSVGEGYINGMDVNDKANYSMDT